MKKEIINVSTLLSSGKKIARLAGNRDLNPKIVKKKKESLKRFGLLSPAIIIEGSKAIEEGLKIIDFETGEELSKEDAAQYIALIEGNHRFKAHMELLEANEKLEEKQKYKKEFCVIYALNDDMPIMEMLAEINICTSKWNTRDIVKGATVINENCPRLLREIHKLMEQGYSLNAASLWFTFNNKVDTKVMDAAMQGKYLDPLKNEAGLERGLNILEVAKVTFGDKLCKNRTTLSGWVVSIYERTSDEDKAKFTDNMIQFMRSIGLSEVEYLQKVKGKIGEGSKEDLINKKLNELWDSFNSSRLKGLIQSSDELSA
jgi:hypothetical protein